MRHEDDKTICSVARSPARRAYRAGARVRGAFTIAEILVVILIIGILISILVVTLTGSIRFGRRQAGQATVTGLAQAVRQFEQTFGFFPPLVQDGIQGTGGAMDVEPAVLDRAGTPAVGWPVEVVPSNDRLRIIVTYNPAYPANRRFLEGIDPTSTGAPSEQDLIDRYDFETAPDAWLRANQRYSKYSLGYYLAGALPTAVDGVDGPGMVRPLTDGTFEGVVADSSDPLETGGRTTARDRYEPFFDADTRGASIAREYVDVDEYRENRADPDLDIAEPSLQTDWRHAAIVDPNGIAYRYYRWEPLSTSYGIPVTATYQMNIPWILLDDVALNRLSGAAPEDAATIDLTAGDPELRGARWAIVGAGDDGLFGTEPIKALRERLRLREADTEDWEVRARAKSDNVVEVRR